MEYKENRVKIEYEISSSYKNKYSKFFKSPDLFSENSFSLDMLDTNYQYSSHVFVLYNKSKIVLKHLLFTSKNMAFSSK